MIEELKKSDKTRRRSRKEAKENSKAKEIVGKSDLEKPEKTSPKKMSDNPVKTNETSKVAQPKTINEKAKTIAQKSSLAIPKPTKKSSTG